MSTRTGRTARWTALASAAVLAVAACGTGQASPSQFASQPASQPPTATGTPAASGNGPSAPASPIGAIGLIKELPPLSPTVTVKARVGSSLTTAPFWYAIEKGYFEQLGLGFEQVQIASSGDVVAPLVTGQIDIAGTSFGSGLYNAILREIEVVAVADNGQLDEDLAGSAAVVKAGTRDQYGDDWCALEGKKVIIVTRTTGLFVTLVKALESCNLTEDDIEVVELGFAETNAAIENGSVEVAFQVEPFVSAGVAQGILDIWKPLDEAREGQQMNILLYSPTFAQNHDVALRFLVAYLAGVRDFRADAESGDPELGQILSRHLPVEDPEAYGEMILMGIDPDGQIDVESVRESLEIYQQTGSLEPGEVRLDWINDDLRNEALSYLPPYTP
jgi:NitT/TauT family transport system substrate-binding protein